MSPILFLPTVTNQHVQIVFVNNTIGIVKMPKKNGRTAFLLVSSWQILLKLYLTNKWHSALIFGLCFIYVIFVKIYFRVQNELGPLDSDKNSIGLCCAGLNYWNRNLMVFFPIKLRFQFSSPAQHRPILRCYLLIFYTLLGQNACFQFIILLPTL